MKEAAIEPAPRRRETSWAKFLRQQAASIRRRVRLAWVTTNPDGPFVTSRCGNLLMQLEDEDARTRFLVRDRDSKFTRGFDEVFRCEGIRVIKAPARAPKARAHAERWSEECAASASTDY